MHTLEIMFESFGVFFLMQHLLEKPVLVQVHFANHDIVQQDFESKYTKQKMHPTIAHHHGVRQLLSGIYCSAASAGNLFGDNSTLTSSFTLKNFSSVIARGNLSQIKVNFSQDCSSGSSFFSVYKNHQLLFMF